MLYCVLYLYVFFFFKQKTAYEMRISDWSSDVCSSDLCAHLLRVSKHRPKSAEGFVKPAHWTNEPVPRPKAVDLSADDPEGLSPTRYGDWEKKDRKSVV